MRTTLTLALLVAGTGCNSATSIRQNGLVPRPRVDSYDGQPMTHAFEIEGHAEGAVFSPAAGRDESSGASVATTEFGGELHVPVRLDGELGLKFDMAIGDNATNTNETNPVGLPNHDSFGFGAAYRHSLPLGDPRDPSAWRLGLSMSMEAWSIARQEEGGAEANDLSGVFALSVVPSKRFGNVVVFGTGTVMNQIGVPAQYVVGTGDESDQSTSPTTSNGGAAALFGIGARFEMIDNLAFVVQASESFNVQGGDTPMIGASIIVGPGQRRDLGRYAQPAQVPMYSQPPQPEPYYVPYPQRQPPPPGAPLPPPPPDPPPVE